MAIKNIFIAFILTAILSGFAWSQEATDTTIKEIKIKTSSQCDQCKERIEKAINKLSGINNANLDVDSKILTVNYRTAETNPDEIRKKVSDTGYDADDIPANPRAYKKLPKCCQKDGH